MGTSALSLRNIALVLLAAIVLALGLMPAWALAEDSPSSGSEGGIASSSNAPAPMLASTMAQEPTAFVSSDVVLDDGAEPVVGSFTVDGMTFAVEENGAMLVTVDPAIAGDGFVAVPATVEYGGVEYGVTAIGAYAFYLSGATEVALPESIALVDERAFRSSDVERVEVDQGNQSYASFDGALYSADLTSLLLIPEGRAGSVSIPCEAEVIAPSVFSHCSLVTSISVDGDGAAFASWDGLLYDAAGMTLVRVPAGATDIAIREGCTTIAAGAMEGCAKLETIEAPSTVVSISPDAFSQEAPVIAFPSDSLIASGSDSDDAGDHEQLAGTVALSAARGKAPEIDLPSIHVVLPDDADRAPWLAASFERIEGGFAPDAAELSGDGAGSDSGDTEMAGIPAQHMMINEDVPLGITEDSANGLPLVLLESESLYAASSDLRLYIHAPIPIYRETYYYPTGGLMNPGNRTEAVSTPYHPGINPFVSNNLVKGEVYWSSSEYVAVRGMGTPDSTTEGIPIQYYIGTRLLTPSGVAGVTNAPVFLGVNSSGCSWKIPRQGEAWDAAVLTTFDWAHVFIDWPDKSFTYDLNGGAWPSGTTATSHPTSGNISSFCTASDITLPTPTRAGYTFSGWEVSSNEDQVLLDAVKMKDTDGNAVAINGAVARSIVLNRSSAIANLTFKACWSKNPIYTVTLKRNAGDTTATYRTVYLWYGKGWYSTSSPTDSSVAMTTIGTPTREGYTYKGFSASPSATSGDYWTSGMSFPSVTEFKAHTTLYAVWTPKQSLLTFDVNGGTWGYNGAGYSTEPKGLRADYGSDMPSPQSGMSPGGKYANPTYTGYTFDGYWDAKTGGTQYYKPVSGDIVESARKWDKDKTTSTTLYAHWSKRASLRVALDKNGGADGTSEIYYWPEKGYTVDSDSTTVVPIGSKLVGSIPVRTNQVFKGYYSSKSGGIQYVDESGNLTSNAPTELSRTATWYAQWVERQFTVDPNGGVITHVRGGTPTGQTSTKPITIANYNSRCSVYASGTIIYYLEEGSSNTEWLNLSRAGYLFAGWSVTGASGDEWDLNSDDTNFSQWGVTLKALWKGVDVTLKWDANGGSEVPDTVQEYADDAKVKLPAEPTRHGWAFQGWFTEPEGGEQVTAETPLPLGGATYHAHWIRWTATFEPDGGAHYFNIYSNGHSTPLDGLQDKEGPHNLNWVSDARVCGSSGGDVGVAFAVQYKPYVGSPLYWFGAKKTGYVHVGWRGVSADGSQVKEIRTEADSEPIQNGWTYTALWRPVVSADVPLEVTAKVDLLGLEEQVEATGWIESRSGGALKVAEVNFTPLDGASELFGSNTANVFLEALAEGSTSADYRFALDAARKESDASKLASFALPNGYGTRIGVGYRFAIPDDVLSAIDPNRFTEVTTPVGQVVYTVALAG